MMMILMNILMNMMRWRIIFVYRVDLVMITMIIMMILVKIFMIMMRWRVILMIMILMIVMMILTSRLSLSSSPLPLLLFTLLFFFEACFTIRGVFTSPFTSFGRIP